MAILSDLPTSVIAQIVEQLNPRLYIDFVRYLPPEVCLKILGFLDPLSLINVARSCRAWYDLALDRKLWEQLYYMEGWKAKPEEIKAWELQVNEKPMYISSPNVLQRTRSEEDGHAHKRRVVSISPVLDGDADMEMIDADRPIEREPVDMEMTGFSIFGNPTSSSTAARTTGISQRMSDLDMRSSNSLSASKNHSLNKGKGVASSPMPTTGDIDGEAAMTSARLSRSSLRMWDDASARFKINWKYLYTMRRRLESNWELGKYSNFRLPHPDHLDEGHGECIYSLQYNPRYLVSGSRDRTLKVWDMETRRCLRTLAKHRGSVLCLQFDSDPEEDIIVSGSSDSDVIIWSFSTGKELQTLRHAHRESVLNVKFDKRILVTCSKDKTIKIFNRKPLRYGELGYQEVDPVPRNIKNYGYSLTVTPEDLPQTPPWTMLGCLEGHGAAVNAVQIHDREVVSASGDRSVKVWDWPTQTCMKTIVGHTKGIACVQYDGRRIVSGSSDNEVKVFDRESGVEVASLRSHSNLVRTVQAGFGDLPWSVEDDLAKAKAVDAEYFKAVDAGLLPETDPTNRSRTRHRQGNAGSTRPEDICAYGAAIPPGGGGGKYGRIVSGSYDTSIIIWRRDKEGIWKDLHRLKQEEAADAAIRQTRAQHSSAGDVPPAHNRVPLPGNRTAGGPPTAPQPGAESQVAAASTHGNGNPPAQTQPASGQALSYPGLSIPTTTPTNPMLAATNSQVESPLSAALGPSEIDTYRQIIEVAVEGGHQAFVRALTSHPKILSQRRFVEAVIDSHASPVVRSQLRQAFSSALVDAQFEQARSRREAMRAQENMGTPSTSSVAGPSSVATQTPTQTRTRNTGTSASSSATTRPTPAAAVPVPQATGAAQQAMATAAAAAAAAAAHQAHAQLHAPAHGVHLHQVPAPALIPQPQVQVQVQIQPHHHHPHVAAAPPLEGHDTANPARVFKLQYDARRIICCSQTSVIVGWDFCNGDPELEEASRFFDTIQ